MRQRTIALVLCSVATIAAAADHPQAARKMRLHRFSGNGVLFWKSNDGGTAAPRANPALIGGTLYVFGRDQTASFDLPPSGWWSTASRGVVHFGPRGTDSMRSPVRAVVLRPGAGVTVRTTNTGIMLDDPPQDAVSIALVIGSDRYCSTCSSPLVDQKGVFQARDCTAPTACEGTAPTTVPPTTTTSTTSTTTTTKPPTTTTTTSSTTSTTRPPTTTTTTSTSTTRPSTTTTSTTSSTTTTTSTTTKPPTTTTTTSTTTTAPPTTTTSSTSTTTRATTTSTTTSTTTTKPTTTTTTVATTTTTTVPTGSPIANAGPDQTAAAGAGVVFNGMGSTDSGGTITSYAWTFGDGARGSGGGVTHAYSSIGVYVATLTVTDNRGAQSSDSAVVTVKSPTWATAIGGVGSDQAYAVATDAAGDTFVGGSFIGTMTVGTTMLTSAGGSDWFIVKYDPTGAVLWARRWGGTDYDQVNGLAVDRATGDVLATGSFGGSASLGGTTLVSAGGQDIAIARYSGATGAHLWSARFGGAGDDAGNAVAVDAGGNVFFTGYFRGKNVPFGTTLLSDAMTTDGNAFLVKLAGAGGVTWAMNFPGNTGENFGTSVAVDATGDVVLGGFFSDLLTIGGTQYFASNGLYDGFVAEFSGIGATLWSRRIGRGTPVDGDDRVTGVAFDGAGDVLVTGQVSGAVDLGGGAVASFGGLDAFVAKYSGSGAYAWARRLGGNGDDVGYGVAVDATGDVLVGGSFESTASFVGASLTSLGFTDGFVAKYDAAGATQWAERLGGAGFDTAAAVAAGSGGYPSVAGSFSGSGLFGTTTLTSAGSLDAVVLRTAP